MVIIEISFRTKTNTDFPDHTDTYKKEDDAHPLSLSPSSWEGLGVGFPFFSFPLPYGGDRGGFPFGGVRGGSWQGGGVYQNLTFRPFCM